MGTSRAKIRLPVTKHVFAHTTPLPAPYQLAIEDTAFQLMLLEENVPRDCDHDCAVAPPTWFSVTLSASTRKRYLYLVQQETSTGMVVVILLFDRSADRGTVADDSNGLRLPPRGSWLRAVVDGAIYVLASDLVLSRKAITAFVGGREPPTTPALPPYT